MLLEKTELIARSSKAVGIGYEVFVRLEAKPRHMRFEYFFDDLPALALPHHSFAENGVIHFSVTHLLNGRQDFFRAQRISLFDSFGENRQYLARQANQVHERITRAC